MGAQTKKRPTYFTLALIIVFFAGIVSLLMPVSVGVADEPAVPSGAYSAGDLAAKAVDFINKEYQGGELINGHTAYVLTLAGEDLAGEKWSGGPFWTAGTRTLKARIEKLGDLCGDERGLISFILGTQNDDGSFGPYGGAYGTKAALQALARIRPDVPAGSAVYDEVKNAIDSAVGFFRTAYQSGELGYEVNGFGFDYRCVEALVEAGEDLSTGDWVYNGKSLKAEVLASAAAAAADTSALDAVYLAKELTVLYAVYPHSDDIATLADAIIGGQNQDGGNFGQSVYDHVMVLTALGKTGNVSRIDQAKALEYLNEFKHEHVDCWGSSAGVAWGGYLPEESDLTAQVLTALSYFEGADDPDHTVFKDIEGGLTYLLDVQDNDTGAVPAQWDSTFSTAETLIALKALGKEYEDYAGNGSPWMKQTRSKTVAECLMAIAGWNDAGRVGKLSEILQQRHSADGFDNNIFSDLWAYLALGTAGRLDSLDVSGAKAYLLSRQQTVAGDAYGSWDKDWADFMATCQAVRSLSHLLSLPDFTGDGEIQTAIDTGIGYLGKWQQVDGSVYKDTPWPDDPLVDTAEFVITLYQQGMDPAELESSDGFSPVDYLLNSALNPDGSFGACRNVLDATEALHAYLLIEQAGSDTPDAGDSGGSSGDDSGGSGSSGNNCSVEIAVVGLDGELLFGPESVLIGSYGKWGLTPLGALHATGLTYQDVNGFVINIAGQTNSGMCGWMYQVNDTVPMVAAKDYGLQAGDRVLWWYSVDLNSPAPAWDDLLKRKVEPSSGGGNEAPSPTPVVPVDVQPAPIPGEGRFADVGAGSFAWAWDAVEALAAAGAIDGVDGVHFEPARAMTRAEFSSLLVRALGLDSGDNPANHFTDVGSGDWYTAAVIAAAEAGLFKGYADGSFRPNDAITREEATVVLARALNLAAPEGATDLRYKDSDKISLWARDSVAIAAARGIVTGFPDGTFRPRTLASRAECAVMVFRLTGAAQKD
ncbi:MAG: S-layer homology domain-containing protein [Bacillota bacterium]